MRFLPRSAEPVEPLDAVRNGENSALPLKAQNVLGTKERNRSKSRKREPPETYVPTGSPPRREDQMSPSPMLPPLNPTEPLTLDTEYTRPEHNRSEYNRPEYNRPNPLHSNPPTGSGRISPFPNMQAQPRYPPRTTSANDLRSQPNGYAYHARQPQRGPPSVTSSSAVQPHQFYPDSKPSIDSFESKMREYYDASTQPLYVSQQTSASAVRDHGLRKGSPMISIHESSSDPTLVKSQKPLKSAMKKSQQDGVKRKDTERKGRRLDIGSLFAHQQKPPSSGDGSPSTHGRQERNFEFFPEETVHAKLQRPQPHARFETQKSVGGQSNNSDSTVREKVFEKDIYDNTKMHVRRPPKGIQNWFDGFDISSDEDEKTWQREREKSRVMKEPPPVELPATEAMQTNGPLPSTFSPYDGALNKQKQQPKQQQSQQQQQQQQRPQQQWSQQQRQHRPAHTRKASMDPVEDNILAIEHAKGMMKRRAEQQKVQPPPPVQERSRASSTKTSSTKHRENESRLAHSRLASQSILSLSSESEDEQKEPQSRRESIGDESVVLGNAASVGMHRPNVPPRQLHTAPANQQENTLRRSISTEKTSGSIPMRLGSDVPMPPMPADRSTLGSPRMADSTAQALRRLNGIRDSNSQPSRSRRTTRSAPDDARSTADRSVADRSVAAETTSSATDGSHMMQVSEEEMILLELMRQKRAAMQKNSFSEGYRLALKREEDNLLQRREGAHKTAIQVLKAKEELMKRQSGTSTVFSEDHDNPAAAAMRRKYSALHKEDVDKALKLERFLSLDPHGQVQVVPGADRFPAPPIVVDDEDGGEEEEGTEEAVDDEEEEMPMLLQAKTYSPMQKLTEKVRDRNSRAVSQSHSVSLSRTTTRSPPDALSDGSLEDHHDRVRAFLASNGASDAQELFPTPPNHSRASMLPDEWPRKGSSRVMSPSPVPEEEPVIDDEDYEQQPARHHARDSRYPEPLQPRTYQQPDRRKKSPRPMPNERRNQYRLSYTADSDPLLETIGGLAPPNHSHRLRDPYPDITPTLEAGPLELPNHGFPGSPSLSSRPSPVTPTFPQVPSHNSDKTSVHGGFVDIAGSASDNASYRGGGRAYTPDTEFSAPVQPTPAKEKKGTRRPPQSNTDAFAAKRAIDRSSTGMSNITSAGEDVLAAWAELGGGSSDFGFRKGGGGGGGGRR